MKVLQIHDKEFALNSNSNTTLDSNQNGNLGGVSIYLSHLVPALKDRGWEVAMIRFTPKAIQKTKIVENFYELRAFGNHLRPTVLASLMRIVKEEKPDIIHLHSSHFALNPFIIHKLIKLKPLIYTLHDVTPLCFLHNKIQPNGKICNLPIGLSCLTKKCYRLGSKQGYLRDIFRIFINFTQLWKYRQFSMIIVPSQYLYKQLLINGFHKDRIRILPHFSRYNGTSISASKNTNDNRILFVGRLVREKGIYEFIEALSLLCSKKWEAIILGDGELLGSSKQFAIQRGLGDHISFQGPASDKELQHYYQSCAFVVFPSLIPESFGLVGIEAMSFKKPVVAFKSGGVTEWLQDGGNGLLADYGNVQQLAQKIDLLFEDTELRERLSENAFKTIRDRFSIEKHLDRLIGLYHQSIEGTHSDILNEE